MSITFHTTGNGAETTGSGVGNSPFIILRNERGSLLVNVADENGAQACVAYVSHRVDGDPNVVAHIVGNSHRTRVCDSEDDAVTYLCGVYDVRIRPAYDAWCRRQEPYFGLAFDPTPWAWMAWATQQEADAEGRYQALRTRYDELQARHNEVCRSNDRWKSGLNAALNEYAEEAGLGDDWDELMEAHGLEMRTREYEVRVQVSGYVTLTIEASNEDGASDSVDSRDVREAVDSDGLRDLDWNVDGVEEA